MPSVRVDLFQGVHSPDGPWRLARRRPLGAGTSASRRSPRLYPSAIATLRLGTQSWTWLPHWSGGFYPPGLGQADLLPFYARVFDTVEVNATFHAIPAASTVRGWRERTPPGFLFALKTPQAITHDLRLALPDCRPLVDEFLGRALLLEDKLGPILVQLPPTFDRSPENRRALADFLDVLVGEPVRVALELRHPSWLVPSVEQALRERNVAWVLTDGLHLSKVVLHTADFAYVRWERSGAAFPDFAEVRLDRSADLDWWAEALHATPPEVGTVYGYMCDEFAGHAPASLRMLQTRLGLPVVDPRQQWPQRRLL